LEEEMKKISIVIILILVLTAAAPVSAKQDRPTVCLLTDTIFGLDFVEYTGLLEGFHKAGQKLQVDAVSFVAEDFSELILTMDAFIAPGACELIIGSGFVTPDFMEWYITEYPEQAFTVLDFEYFPEYENVSEVLFQVDQGAFMAGYLAAGLSETGAIGVYGGMQFNRVTEFMDGYALGAAYYNDQYGAAVEVLGWDPWTQVGLFTWDFGNPDLGRMFTLDLFEAGADTVFAVAGPTGEGSLQAAAEWKAAGEDVRVVQPDFDWYDAHGDPYRILLTSVLKNFDVAAYHAVEAFVTGTWESGLLWEDLASGGVDIAPFHKTSSQVPGPLKNDLKAIRLGIMDGSITTMP
jgi:basic membrane protein A